MALLFLIAGCGEESRISVSARLPAPLSIELLTVTVMDGDRRIQWNGSNFGTRPGGSDHFTPEVEIETSGPDLQVTYLLESSGSTISMGSVIVPRRSDWKWNIGVEAATQDPAEFCFGCFGSEGFALAEPFRTPERDSIWVVWGGNSISDPAIY